METQQIINSSKDSEQIQQITAVLRSNGCGQHVRNVSNGGDPTVNVDLEESLRTSHEELLFQDLPYDLLVDISTYFEPKELVRGLSQTNREFHTLFAEETYWQERVRSASKDYYKVLSGLRRTGVDFPWSQRAHYWERLHYNFKWKHMRERFFGEENQQLLGNFRCLEFGGQGHYLAFAAKDRLSVSVWHLDDPLNPDCPAELILCHDHDQKVTSLRALGNQLSSGAFDGTICIRDVDRLDGPPVQILCSGELVVCHVWEENRVVSATRSGAIEVFDPRIGEDPQFRQRIYAPTEVFNDVKLQQRCHDVVTAGWDLGVRKLKLFDLRNGEVVTESDAGTWNLSMHLGDGQLWVGGDKGKVKQFDPDTFEVVQDCSADFGHFSNLGWLPDVAFLECVRCVLYSHGHLFTADLRQVKLHELGRKPRLIWEDEIVFSELAFCEERCLLAAAVGHTPDQIKFFSPGSF